MPSPPQIHAYFLTWRTYGTWLRGDERGFVDETQNEYGMPFRAHDLKLDEASKGLMKQPAMEFDDPLRHAVDASIREACGFRQWHISALNVRTNHVHLVVHAEDNAEKVMNVLKGRVTRELRRDGLIGPYREVWARGGSKRKLWDELAVLTTIDYVLNRQ